MLLVPPSKSIKDVLHILAQGGKRCFGVALIVDSCRRLQGLLNQGDLLRLIARGTKFSLPVGFVARTDPVCVNEGWSDQKIVNHVREEFLRRTGGKRSFTQYVPVLDRQSRVVGMVDMYEVLARLPSQGQPVAIYGLGYVGLTLGAALASRGHAVLGIDLNPKIVFDLQKGKSHVHEPRLLEMLQQGLASGMLRFSKSNLDYNGTVHIVAVGTPVGSTGTANLSQLRQACRAVGSILKRGDLVMLRSTLPVGTTRQHVTPLLENAAGLTGGKGFHVAFCPERTVEGRALHELFSLPQIVGGLSEACYEKAAVFWATLTDSVIRSESVEAAELIKLVNNSFRDLSFSFSNAVALWADRFNLDMHKLIATANEGYPRNSIPRPSPGVGGYCLSKDPLLLAGRDRLPHAQLVCLGRKINVTAADYPLNQVKRHLKNSKITWKKSLILVIGVAFKGDPETNDLRNSVSISIISKLKSQGAKVLVWDAVVKNIELRKKGFKPAKWPKDLGKCDAVMILNNHPKNISDKFLQQLPKKKSVLIFDGWGLLNRSEVEQRKNLTYGTMGYMTAKRR